MKKIFFIISLIFLFSCEINIGKKEEVSLFEKNKECFKLIKDFDFSKTQFYNEKDYFISNAFYSKKYDTCVLKVVHHFEKSPEGYTTGIGEVLYDFIKYQELESLYSNEPNFELKQNNFNEIYKDYKQ